MALFDVTKYQIPKADQVDMRLSRENFEIFMTEYGAVREKVGKNRMPKMTQSFGPTASSPFREYSGDAERFMIERGVYARVQRTAFNFWTKVPINQQSTS
ncbi:MAG: hypothetical protein ACLSIL_19855 [Enterococcus casseliflavus]